MISTTVSPKIGKAMSQAATRHNSSRQERLSIFYQAVEMIKTTKQWSNGEVHYLHQGTLGGKKASIYLVNENSGINLYLFIDNETLAKRFYSKPFQVGYFNPQTGFQLIAQATEESYLAWNFQTRKALSK